jgi:hypothetical protein
MPKASLTRKNLEQNCIWVQPDFPFEYDDSPSHVQTLHDIVLDFAGTIQDRFNLPDEADPWDVQQLPLWHKLQEQQNVIKRSIRTAEIAADKARHLQSGKLLEGSWTDYFNEKFFQPLCDANLPSDEDSRKLVCSLGILSVTQGTTNGFQAHLARSTSLIRLIGKQPVNHSFKRIG